MFISRILESDIKRALQGRKVLFLLGARQVGKTTIVQHLLSSQGGTMLNMDIDVDRSRLIAASSLPPQDAMRALGADSVLVIDEAQRVPDIGRICKGWYDAGVKTRIILLGSASAVLLSSASAELTGRNEKLWLTPLLFREVLETQEWFHPSFPAESLTDNFSTQIRTLLIHRMVFGSYPEAFLSSDPRQYLTNLTGDYLLKDIFADSLIRSPEDIKRLLLELAGEIGHTVSVLQLANRLKISRQTVQRYLDILESIFVIFSVPSYHTDPDKEVTKSRKYYFWDTGVKNALQREWVISERRSDINALWENWVMAEIWKQSRTYNRHEDLFFWHSRNDSTVDLIVRQGEKLHAFDIRFNPMGYKASRSFENMYNVKPRVIHPDAIVDFVL